MIIKKNNIPLNPPPLAGTACACSTVLAASVAPAGPKFIKFNTLSNINTPPKLFFKEFCR
jgi:hypothetical protein